MEGKSSYFVLLIIVACLSITLAFLAIGYFFFGTTVSGDGKEVVVLTQKIPSDDEITNKVIFESKNFNLKKTDDKQVAVINVSASMKHYTEIKGEMTAEEVTKKIEFYSNEINAAFGTYFQDLTLEQVADKATKQKAEKDLAKQINEILTRNDKKASPLVYTITFDYWFYQ